MCMYDVCVYVCVFYDMCVVSPIVAALQEARLGARPGLLQQAEERRALARPQGLLVDLFDLVDVFDFGFILYFKKKNLYFIALSFVHSSRKGQRFSFLGMVFFRCLLFISPPVWL